MKYFSVQAGSASTYFCQTTLRILLVEDSVKDYETRDALRDEGVSQGEEAPVADAREASSSDHDSRPFEERTRDQLRLAAKERNIKGRGSMNKAELIEALRK